jgi:hypothetical protein
MALKNHDRDLITSPDSEVPRETQFILEHYTDAELLKLRSLIDDRLEIGHIGSIDLGSEIMVQLRTLKALQRDALSEQGVPVNQKAQAASTVSRLLQDLVKSRNKLYSAERMKQIEEMTIEAIKDCPEDVKTHFFERLERLLATLPTLASMMAEE